MKRGVILVLVALLAAGWMSGCASGGADGLAVEDVWARPGISGGNSAIYFVINNRRGQDDTLLSASTGAAQIAELHISKIDDAGNMTMEHQDNVPVPGGKTVTFEPGGLHVMMMGLNGDLKAGDTLTATLTFEKAGSIEIEATVREP